MTEDLSTWPHFVRQHFVRLHSGSRATDHGKDSEAFVIVVESTVEHSISRQLMLGAAKPRTMKVDAGTTLVKQCETGSYVYPTLDGVARIQVDGARVAEYGRGALLDERALLERALCTSSIVAVTSCKVASVRGEEIGRAALEKLSLGRRREDTSAG